MRPGDAEETAACARISELLARVGDKWTLLVVRELGDGPVRFNALRRRVGDISQKMLASTLRGLERDGPQVEYALTDLGHGLLEPVKQIAAWTVANAARIEAARRAYDARAARPAPLRAAVAFSRR